MSLFRATRAANNASSGEVPAGQRTMLHFFRSITPTVVQAARRDSRGSTTSGRGQKRPLPDDDTGGGTGATAGATGAIGGAIVAAKAGTGKRQREHEATAVPAIGEGVRFYTRLKTVTTRWPSGIKDGAVFNFKRGSDH